jgi:hypothetical protein
MTGKTKYADVLIQHNSMQFSDDVKQHTHDTRAVFQHARETGALFVTGTESGTSPLNHDLHDLVIEAAKEFDYHVNAHKWGDWAAVDKRRVLKDSIAHGYEGPFVPGTKGLKASQGGHSPRGITTITAEVKAKGVGVVTIGSCHFLTHRSTVVSGPNTPLVDGIARWAHGAGSGHNLVFLDADANLNDERVDVFNGNPLTTCWDELDRYPATHGLNKKRGTTIDIIASYDKDGRVTCKWADSLDDSDLKLATDHFMIQALYKVKV